MPQRTKRTEMAVEPCKCASSDCPVVLVLRDKSRHAACKHSLVNVSEYFETMFRTEKQTNEIELQEDISKRDLAVFLKCIQHPFKPLPSNAGPLRSLIFLADRFVCPSLGKEILPKLVDGSLFTAPAKVKLELLETADRHRGNSTAILEACVRLCGNLELDQVSSLHGKITDGTLAAALLFVGKVRPERTGLADRPTHRCGRNRRIPYDRMTRYGTWICDTCYREEDVTEDILYDFAHNMFSLFDPVTFEMVREIPIERAMFG